MVVRKTICSRSFDVVDPATYPYAQGCFDEEEPIHPDWCAYGSGTTLVDVGACFGAFTLPALAAGANVLAFEPSDDGYRILRENVSLNSYREICLVKAAMYDGGEYPQALHKSVFGESYPAKSVYYTTLDNLIADPIGVTAIKIDVEGGELGVLCGAKHLLARCRPVLFIEDHQDINRGHIVSDYPATIHSRENIAEMLAGLGYKLERREWHCNRGYIVARP